MGYFGLSEILVVFAILTLYFIPIFIAIIRKNTNLVPVFLINFLFGWTLVGWVISLIWACKNDTVPIE